MMVFRAELGCYGVSQAQLGFAPYYLRNSRYKSSADLA